MEAEMDDNSKKLKKMATWTIAVFATVFAVFMAFFWLFNPQQVGGSSWSKLGAALSSGWIIFLTTAVLCLAAYFGYKMFLNRKK